ncbi:HD-GYP domain-containing protein [Methylobacterium pseudosasicola]|uniref:HDIG domain-containing protein n=1 Tax=Methylobacterium pseudosasicola TaxID=582667 RepID=A0A1I4H409_9HYPH|nr:HD domain-containing phosphohydrolase [Methylobacterium pseudosasicola]SFL36935.1 HDIG domain-containing protein [Methylobacterium pseudosasicola]
MGELLLISDDLRRAERLARDFGASTASRIHDLYDDEPFAAHPGAIVSDVERLTSDAIIRLRRILGQVRGKGVPYLFLVHGNAARAEAQAQVLGADGLLSASASARQLLDTLGRMRAPLRSVPVAVQAHACEAGQFLKQVLLSGKPITPVVAEIGTDLVVRAVSDSGIHDWIRAVQRFDDATHQHCLLVASLAAAFSAVLGLRAADRHRLTKAALLHDVGKIHVPTEILNKPGKLTESETAVMRTHPARGYHMLVGAGFEDGMLAAVRSHHEMLDGSGYPDQLPAREIPDLVRLVTICDVYGALIERRPYRAPMPGERAYGVLKGMAGRLDADFVRAFQPVAAAKAGA